MTARAKSAVVATALAALTLWPLVHLWLVARYDLSPWKLAGWGMYSVPRARSLGMEVFGRRHAGTLAHLDAPTPAIRAEAGRYLERHRWLRKLVCPTALAAAVAAAHPHWDDVVIAVFEPELVRTTGMIVRSVLVHRYTRPAAGSPDAALTYEGTIDPRAAGLPPALLQ